MSGKHNTNKYIAYCRPRDSNSLLAMSQKHLQIAFADLQKRYKNITFLRTTLSDKRFTPKAFIQSCMTTFEPVLNSFIIHRVKTKSNECLSVAFTGHASSPYKITGMHFTIINLTITSSEAILHILPKTALKERKYAFLALR